MIRALLPQLPILQLNYGNRTPRCQGVRLS